MVQKAPAPVEEAPLEGLDDAAAAQLGEQWAAEFDVSQVFFFPRLILILFFFLFFSVKERQKKKKEKKKKKIVLQGAQIDPFQGGDMEEWMKKFTEGKGLDWGHQPIQQKEPEYVFSQDNQYLENNDPYALGLALLKEGKLKPAIKAFEAATQK